MFKSIIQFQDFIRTRNYLIALLWYG